jgi:adenine phosphoribosyltransferase
MADLETRLRALVRDIPDYPKPGIVFKDITPLLGSPAAFREACDAMAEPYLNSAVSHVIAIESRGFLFGGAVAVRLGAGLVPVRKVGRLPFKTERVEYALEYGKDSLEMHVDALPTGSRVLIVDDVLATGGTAAATVRLATKLGASVAGCAFLVRLSFLPGLTALGDVPTTSLITY